MKRIGSAGSTLGTIVAAAVVLTIAATGGAVAGGLVTSARIKNNTIQSIDVRNGSLTGIDVKDGSLGAADLGAGAVKATKLGTITERTNSVLIANNDGASLTVSCLAGERLISGGTSTGGVGISAGWTLIRSGPLTNSWTATARNATGTSATLIVEALCLG